MAKTRVEKFSAETTDELEYRINHYCEKRNLEIVSISVFANWGSVYAFVVVKEGADNEQ